MFKNQKKAILTISITLFFITNVLLSNSNLKGIFDILSYQEVQDVSITLNLEALSDRRSSEKIKATLSFLDADKILQTWEIGLEMRGRFRRTRCEELPPLKIHFKKGDLKKAGLATFDELKLVNQCQQSTGYQLLEKEYLAYKLYNEISDHSLRVQFLNITYIDRKSGRKEEQRGFIIEDIKQLSARIGATKGKQKVGFTEAQFNKNQFQTMALFQYLIGNSDWNNSSFHNLKVLMKGDHYIAIPYDFDFSGIVNAHYAIPNVNYGLTSVKQRVFLGFSKEASELKMTIDRFIRMRKVMEQTVKNCTLLNRRNRKRTWAYLRKYFKRPKRIVFGQERNRTSKK